MFHRFFISKKKGGGQKANKSIAMKAKEKISPEEKTKQKEAKRLTSEQKQLLHLEKEKAQPKRKTYF